MILFRKLFAFVAIAPTFSVALMLAARGGALWPWCCVCVLGTADAVLWGATGRGLVRPSVLACCARARPHRMRARCAGCRCGRWRRARPQRPQSASRAPARPCAATRCGLCGWGEKALGPRNSTALGPPHLDVPCPHPITRAHSPTLPPRAHDPRARLRRTPTSCSRSTTRQLHNLIPMHSLELL